MHEAALWHLCVVHLFAVRRLESYAEPCRIDSVAAVAAVSPHSFTDRHSSRSGGTRRRSAASSAYFAAVFLAASFFSRIASRGGSVAISPRFVSYAVTAKRQPHKSAHNTKPIDWNFSVPMSVPHRNDRCPAARTIRCVWISARSLAYKFPNARWWCQSHHRRPFRADRQRRSCAALSVGLCLGRYIRAIIMMMMMMSMERCLWIRDAYH